MPMAGPGVGLRSGRVPRMNLRSGKVSEGLDLGSGSVPEGWAGLGAGVGQGARG